MSREVFYDLDTNKVLEGNYFYCNIKLIDSVLALLENGYDVIDCKLSDDNNIYLDKQDISVDIKDTALTQEDIIQEGKDIGEYRRITHSDSEVIKYDSFKPDDSIEIKILGTHEFSNVPEGIKIFNIDGCTIIRIKIDKISYEDNMYGSTRTLTKLDVSSTINKLNSWIESITGKEVTKVQYDNNSYGNSYMAIDYNNKQIIKGNYILIDPLMVPVISELRQKGYHTLGCCSGHHDSLFIQNTSIIPEEQFLPKKVESWIVFSNEYPVPQPPEGAESMNVSNFYRISYSKDIVNIDVTYKPSSVIKEEIEYSMNKLLEWSKNLPFSNSINHSL